MKFALVAIAVFGVYARADVDPPPMPEQGQIEFFRFAPGRSCANAWIDES